MDSELIPDFGDPEPAPSVAVAVVVAEPAPEEKGPIEGRIKALVLTIPAEVNACRPTRETLPMAYVLLKRIVAYRREWAEHMDPHIEGAQEAKRIAEKNRKRLVDDKASKDGPLELAQKKLQAAIDAVEREIEAEKEAERRQIQAAADKKAEEEALAAAITLAEEAKTAPPEVAAVLTQEAEAILDRPTAAPPVEIAPWRPAEAKGVSRPEKWSARVVDLDKLLTAIVAKDRRLNASILQELRSRITEAIDPCFNKRAATERGTMNYPGVSCTSEKGFRHT